MKDINKTDTQSTITKYRIKPIDINSIAYVALYNINYLYQIFLSDFCLSDSTSSFIRLFSISFYLSHSFDNLS